MRTWSRPLPDSRCVLRANNMSGLVLAVTLGIGLGALWPDGPIEHDDVSLVLRQDVRRTVRVGAFAEALDARVAEVAPQLELRASVSGRSRGSPG